MHRQDLALAGAYLLIPQRIDDERGFFARTYSEEEFEAWGLNTHWVQCNVSFNHRAGTVRGMHYQVAPHEEVKLVRCTMGAIDDVIVDIRPESPTYRQFVRVTLSAENRHALYIPIGFAHGFQALHDDTEVFYQMGMTYHPESARGFRHDDPAIGITWSLPVSVISPRDLAFPPLAE